MDYRRLAQHKSPQRVDSHEPLRPGGRTLPWGGGGSQTPDRSARASHIPERPRLRTKVKALDSQRASTYISQNPERSTNFEAMLIKSRTHLMRTTSTLSIIVSALATSICLSQALADNIVIANPSFEQPSVLGGQYLVGPIAGWTTSAGTEGGVLSPTAADYPGGVPDGHQVGWLNTAGSVSQVLSDTLQANKQYKLTVQVGQRSIYQSLGVYAVQLLAGDQVLGSSSPVPANGQFATAEVDYTALPGDALLGRPLQVVISKAATVSGEQLNFDMVQFQATAIPTPNNLVVVNPSFEQPATSGGQYLVGPITGWTTSPGAEGGVLYPTAVDYPGGVPDGHQVGWLNTAGSVSQVLSDTLQANTQYKLTVQVGQRSIYQSLGAYAVQLLAGDQVLGSSSPVPDNGKFATAEVDYTALPNDALLGRPLQVVVTKTATVSGEQLNFDLVQLQATPVPAGTNQCAPDPVGLVSWFPLDGNLSDVAGTSAATLQGAATYSPGEVAQGLQFDGSSTSIRIAASQPLDLGQGPGLTVEMWIKPSDVSYQQPLAEWNDGNGNIQSLFWISVAANGGGSGSLFASLADSSGGYHSVSSDTGVLVSNVFQHVALTYDKANGVLCLFSNGQIVKETVVGTFNPLTSADLYLGLRPSGTAAGNRYFGTMDEVSIYSRALQPAEVMSIFQAGSQGKCRASAPPTITQQPLGQSVAEGDPFTLSVTAAGSPPLSYQWTFKGTNIDGATNSSFVVVSATPANAGDYKVTISDAGGSITSVSATVTVLPALANALVVPPQFTNTDASGLSGIFYAAPGLRIQEVYAADLFALNGPILITEIRLRRDPAAATFQTTNSSIRFVLSTTQKAPGALSLTFADNLSSDQTVVFDGSLVVSSLINKPATGAMPFDIVIPLTQPFLYDPAAGNLLLDVLQSAPSSSPSIEASNDSNDSASRVFAYGASQDTAQYSDTGADVLELGFVPETSSGCLPPPTDLVAWWPLDGDGRDPVGADPGVVLGDGLFVQGEVGEGLHFDGANDSVHIAASPTLDVGKGAGLTFETWIKPSTVAFQQPLFEWNDNQGNIQSHFWISVELGQGGPGSLLANLADSTGGYHWFSSTPGFVTTNNFQHVAFTYDKASGMARLLYNGQVVREENLGSFAPATSSDLYLGFRPSGTAAGNRFFGVMDEASIYGRALSPEEVLGIVQAGRQGKCKPPLPPFITHQPRSQSVADGDLVTLSVTATGSSPLAYQWTFKSNDLTGATNAVLVIAQATAGDSGDYTVRISNAVSSVTSDIATLAVTPGPPNALVLPPRYAHADASGLSGILDVYPGLRLQEVYASELFHSSAPIVISELRFRRDPSAPPFHATNSGMRLALSTTQKEPGGLSTTFSDNSGPDQTIVFDGSLAVSSLGDKPESGPMPFDIVVHLTQPFLYDPLRGNLLLDVYNPTPSSAPYVEASNDLDDSASRVFSIGAEATVAQYSDTGADVVQIGYTIQDTKLVVSPLPGNYDHAVHVALQTSVTNGIIHYTLDGSAPTVGSPTYHDPLRLTSTTTLKAVVYADGSAVSDIISGVYSILLTPPSISQQPQSVSVVAGQNLTLAVTASGSAPLVYQWALDGNDLAGAIDPTLTLTSVTLTNQGVYTVRVSNDAGTITSAPATITVTPAAVAPTILEQPKSLSVAVGGTARFTVQAAGTGPLSYQWLHEGSAVANGRSPTLILPNVHPNDAGRYTVRVRNGQGSVTSDVATLTVQSAGSAPIITVAPQDQEILVGADLRLTVTASGTPPLTYQWMWNGAPIPGAISAALDIPNVQTTNQGTYTVTVSNSVGSASDNGAVVDIVPAANGGTVIFDNRIVSPPAPVFDSDGTTPLAGIGFLAQLYAGPSADALAPIGPAVPFRTGLAAGYVSPGVDSSRTITTVSPGAVAAVQIRAWESVAGPSYELAVVNGGKTGHSDILSIVTGGAGAPPAVPAPLDGLKSFSITKVTTPPVITLTSPVAGSTQDERFTVAGTVVGTVAIASVQWVWDGQSMGALALTGGQFSLAGHRLHRGDNHIQVSAQDAAGNQTSTEVVVTWQPSRVLSLADAGDVQEGQRITMPLRLVVSQGDVSGLSFALHYDPTILGDPQFTWSTALGGAAEQVNLDLAGGVRGTFSLPGVAIPAGTNELGQLSFRARSVPGATQTAVTVDALDVADTFGNLVVFGTDAVQGNVQVLPRHIIGDNNGNNLLDVGDATLMQRLIAQLDPVRAWDITDNDLNGSGTVDSGDVIKVLRAVVGLDVQPTRVSASRIGTSGLSPNGALGSGVTGGVVLQSSQPVVVPGGTINVAVVLNDLSQSVSGASFVLHYPADSLTLVGSSSVRTGSLVPSGAASLWNVVPSYAAQAGEVRAAVSTPTPWAATSGVLAQMTFQVLPAALTRGQLPISLSQIEVTSQDGYDMASLPSASVTLATAQPVSAQEPQLTKDGLHFSFAGQVGMSYDVEASTDLVHWEKVQTLAGSISPLEFSDPAAAGLPARFYRIKTVVAP